MSLSYSVIIPAYNCSKTIERCINSIFIQTLLPERVYVIDDCSSDNTFEILRKLSSHYPLELSKNSTNID